MGEIVQFKDSGNLPADPSSLANIGGAVAQTASAGVGTDLLRLLRDGTWVFGADNTEPEEGSEWAINPYSFMHGAICWGDSSNVLGEIMVPVNQPFPNRAEFTDHGFKWDDQLAFQLQCITGEDAGVQVVYKTTSVGGKRAVGQIATAVANQASQGISEVVPIVTLGVDNYQHKQYGKIYTPELSILRWVDLSGEESEPADEAPKKASRSRKK